VPDTHFPDPDEEAIEFGGDDRVRIPDAEYSAVLVYHETSFIFRTPKVYLWFRIIDPGPLFEVMVFRAYRVKRITGKPKRNGGFKLGRGSDLFMDLVRLLGIKSRPDRISPRELRNRIWRIRTRTVKTDYAQRALVEWQQYSVVGKLLRSDS
jgi:hypothetical protein